MACCLLAWKQVRLLLILRLHSPCAVIRRSVYCRFFHGKIYREAPHGMAQCAAVVKIGERASRPYRKGSRPIRTLSCCGLLPHELAGHTRNPFSFSDCHGGQRVRMLPSPTVGRPLPGEVSAAGEHHRGEATAGDAARGEVAAAEHFRDEPLRRRRTKGGAGCRASTQQGRTLAREHATTTGKSGAVEHVAWRRAPTSTRTRAGKE
jgi:hypothetical protein